MSDRNQEKSKDFSAMMVERDKQLDVLQQELRDAHQKFEILTKATNDAVWDWDIQTGIIEWNHGLHTLFGYDETIDDQNQAAWIDKIHPMDREETLTGLKQTFEQRNVNWNAMYRFRCRNGNYKYTFDRGYVIYDGANPVRMIGAMQDIDERMTALQEIEKLSLVASKTDNLVIITDADEKIEWVNEGFIKSTGYSLHEVVGKNPRMLQGPETDKLAISRIRKKIDARESVTEEVLNYTKAGKKLWLKITINPVFDDDHNLVRLVAVETDVTPHKEYENKITVIAKEFSDIIENANAVILGVDKNGLVNEWNKHAASATGYLKHEVFGQKLIDFVVGSSRKQVAEDYMRHVLSGNTIDLTEFEIISRSGRHDILLLSATPRRDPSGEIIGLIAVGQDITELTEYRKSLEKKVSERTYELNKSLEKEKELAVLKTQFASMVSHEFRTPLSTIKVSANHIRKYKQRLSDEDIDAKINVVLKQVEHMTHLLENVLIISKAEGNKIQIARERINLIEFFETIKEEVERNNKDTHTINLQFNLVQGEVSSDPDLLRNIFINLLNNAIKFSPDKSAVYLTILQEENTYIFNVRDEGIGIPKEDQDKLFTPFHRGSNASVIQGTGLGLSIVKKAVDLMSGSIEVISNAGEGSIFTITIPMK